MLRNGIELSQFLDDSVIIAYSIDLEKLVIAND